MPLFVHILSIVRRITSFARPLHPRATLLFGCQARDITWLPVRRPDISPSPPLLFTRLLVFFNRNSRKRPGYIRPWAFSFSYPSLFLSVFFILRLQTFSTVDVFFFLLEGVVQPISRSRVTSSRRFFYDQSRMLGTSRLLKYVVCTSFHPGLWGRFGKQINRSGFGK